MTTKTTTHGTTMIRKSAATTLKVRTGVKAGIEPTPILAQRMTDAQR